MRCPEFRRHSGEKGICLVFPAIFIRDIRRVNIPGEVPFGRNNMNVGDIHIFFFNYEYLHLRPVRYDQRDGKLIQVGGAFYQHGRGIAEIHLFFRHAFHIPDMLSPESPYLEFNPRSFNIRILKNGLGIRWFRGGQRHPASVCTKLTC